MGSRLFALIVGLLAHQLLASVAHAQSSFTDEGGAQQTVPTAVELQLSHPLGRGERYSLTQAGVTVGEYLGDNRYRALLSPGLSTASISDTFAFVQAVRPIQAIEKFSPELRAGEVPEYAQLPGGRLKLRVEVFKTQPQSLRQLLLRYAETAYPARNAEGWDIEIDRQRVESLASEPEIKHIEVIPDPSLLW